jgi:hypothetical protein
VSKPIGGLLFKTILGSATTLGLLVSGAVGPARAAPPACGFVSGGLPDPAQTQRCLAERFKAPPPKPSPRPKPAPASAPAPSNAESSSAPPPSATPPPAQGS